MTDPVRRPPASRLHAAAGAVSEREAGWDLPARYGDVAVERERLTTSVVIADVTPRAKVDVRGRIEGIFEAAGGIAARVGPDWGLILGSPGDEDRLVAAAQAAGPGTMVTDVTHLFAGYALAGPALDDLMPRITGWDHRRLAPGAATGAAIGEVRAIVVRRDLTFPCLEVYVATEFARYAWETYAGAVARTGGGPVGWIALREEGWT